MLACCAEGVGCTLTTLLCYVETRIKELLEIPEDWHMIRTFMTEDHKKAAQAFVQKKTPHFQGK